MKGMEDMEGHINYLNRENCMFNITQGGFLKLYFEGKEYTSVELYKPFPFTYSRSYIFVRDQEGKEIGCIRNLDDFPQETIQILDVELKRRYFIPRILKIIKLKEELGDYKWEVETNSGKMDFKTSRRRGSLLMIGEKRIIIKDIFGDRYEIPDVEVIKNNKHRRMIEAVIY